MHPADQMPLYDLRSTRYVQITAPSVVVRSNPQRVMLLFVTPMGAAPGTMRINLTNSFASNDGIDITPSGLQLRFQHPLDGAMAQCEWWMNGGGGGSVQVLEVILARMPRRGAVSYDVQSGLRNGDDSRLPAAGPEPKAFCLDSIGAAYQSFYAIIQRGCDTRSGNYLIPRE